MRLKDAVLTHALEALRHPKPIAVTGNTLIIPQHGPLVALAEFLGPLRA